MDQQAKDDYKGVRKNYKIRFELKRLDLVHVNKEYGQKFNYFCNQVWNKLREEDD
jgi:hypothetical protein